MVTKSEEQEGREVSERKSRNARSGRKSHTVRRILEGHESEGLATGDTNSCTVDWEEGMNESQLVKSQLLGLEKRTSRWPQTESSKIAVPCQ